MKHFYLKILLLICLCTFLFADLIGQDCVPSGQFGLILELSNNGLEINDGAVFTVCAGTGLGLDSKVSIPDVINDICFTGDTLVDSIQYVWIFPPSSTATEDDCGNMTISNITPFDGGVYTLNIIGQCVSGDSMITITPSPTISFTLEVTEPQDLSGTSLSFNCLSGTAVLEVEGVSNDTNIGYTWSNPDSMILGITTIGHFTLSEFAEEGTYTVVIDPPCGVTVNRTVDFSRLVSPTITLNGANSICPGETVVLQASGSGSEVTYEWGSSGMPEGNTLTVEPGAYWVRATSPIACTSLWSDTIIIGELDRINLAISDIPSQYCTGDTVTIVASNDQGIDLFDLLWSNGEMGPSISVFDAGTFTATISGIGDLCDGSTEVMVPAPTPLPVLPQQTSVTISAGNNVLIPIETGNLPLGSSINWEVSSISDGVTILSTDMFGTGNEIVVSPMVEDARSGSGTILYVITASSEGCVSEPVELLVRVILADEEPFIPEVVSPNGDGMNDEWAVLFPNVEERYQINVYSRGGSLVFSGNQDQLPWDTGSCPNGTYYYQIQETGTDRFWQGALTIIGRR